MHVEEFVLKLQQEQLKQHQLLTKNTGGQIGRAPEIMCPVMREVKSQVRGQM